MTILVQLLPAVGMIYVYPEKNIRAYPGVERGSKEWDETYKIRANVEKSITLRTVSALPN